MSQNATNQDDATRSQLYPQSVEGASVFTAYVHSPLSAALSPGVTLHRSSYVRTHARFRRVQSCVDLRQLQELLDDERQATPSPLDWETPKFIAELVAERTRARG